MITNLDKKMEDTKNQNDTQKDYKNLDIAKYNLQEITNEDIRILAEEEAVRIISENPYFNGPFY